MTQASPEIPTIGQSYLQMPYNQYVWLRKEFMSLCRDEDEAMILRVIEYEIEGDRRVWLRNATELIEQGKEAPEEPIWWIALSHRQIVTRLYDAIKNEKTVRAKLQSLMERQFILMRPNPNNLYGSPQYTINKAVLQEKLNALPPLPGIKEAAKSQVTPLPETVPPTRNGTPYQSRQGGATKTGTSPLPETGGPPYQKREVPPTRNGTPYKKERNKEPEEAKERETQSSTSTQSSASSLSLSPQKSFQEESEPAVANVNEKALTFTSVSTLEPSHNDAVMPNATLLDRLTEEQSAFWTRWCAVSGARYESLNQTAIPHIVKLAEKAVSTGDVQSLYDVAYARIREFAESVHKAVIPPRLGNLVNALPDWEAMQAKKEQGRAEERVSHQHIQGTGKLVNYTEQRLAGKAPEPIVYTSFEKPKPVIKGVSGIGVDAATLLEEYNQRRITRQQNSKRL